MSEDAHNGYVKKEENNNSLSKVRKELLAYYINYSLGLVFRDISELRSFTSIDIEEMLVDNILTVDHIKAGSIKLQDTINSIKKKLDEMQEFHNELVRKSFYNYEAHLAIQKERIFKNV